MGKYYHRQCSRKVAEGGLVYYIAELQLLMPDGKLHYLCGSFRKGMKPVSALPLRANPCMI